jgi:hypothetical protein
MVTFYRCDSRCDFCQGFHIICAGFEKKSKFFILTMLKFSDFCCVPGCIGRFGYICQFSFEAVCRIVLIETSGLARICQVLHHSLGHQHSVQTHWESRSHLCLSFLARILEGTVGKGRTGQIRSW